MSGTIKVLIVDDHPLFRQGLRQLVESDARFEFAGETGDGSTAMTMIAKLKPDLALLDITLPGLSGLEIARQLQAKRVLTRIVFLTMHNDKETFNRAMDLGVRGFVLKDDATQHIISCLISVARDGHYLSPSISGHLLQRRHRADELATQKPGLDTLTKAELRVLKLIADQKTSRAIAEELFVSQRTIEAHRANISAKLSLHGSHSLLKFALENRSAL